MAKSPAVKKGHPQYGGANERLSGAGTLKREEREPRQPVKGGGGKGPRPRGGKKVLGMEPLKGEKTLGPPSKGCWLLQEKKGQRGNSWKNPGAKTLQKKKKGSQKLPGVREKTGKQFTHPG